MKKLLKLFLVSVSIISSAYASSDGDHQNIQAQPEKTFTITSITPIKSGMSGEERKSAAHTFLNKVFTPENELNKSDFISQRQHCAPRPFTIYTHNNGSEWVQAIGSGMQRFLGYIYLKEAMEHYTFQHFAVAPTKFLYVKDTARIKIIPSVVRNTNIELDVLDAAGIISFSAYVGDEKVQSLSEEELKEFRILDSVIHFKDTPGFANLRRKDGKIYVIDTEYGSFRISPK